jgi:hypothetical protein
LPPELLPGGDRVGFETFEAADGNDFPLPEGMLYFQIENNSTIPCGLARKRSANSRS